MIDLGGFLTTTTSAGSGTQIPVQDVKYFFDGFTIAGEVGDLIQLQVEILVFPCSLTLQRAARLELESFQSTTEIPG